MIAVLAHNPGPPPRRLPTSPDADPSAAIRAVEDELTRQTDVRDTAEQVLQSHAVELTRLQAEARQMALQLQPMVQGGSSLLDHLTLMRQLRNYGVLALPAAVLAGNMVSAVAGVAVAGLGLLVALGAGTRAFRVNRQVENLHLRAEALRDSLKTAEETAARLGAEMGGLRAAVASADDAIQAMRSRVDLARMTRVLNSPLAQASVSIETDAVCIGGVRVPRKAAVPA